MKLKLFNGGTQIINFNVLAGGYDTEQGKVVIIVQGDHGEAGQLVIDIKEATRMAPMLTTGLPEIKQVTT